MVLEAVGPEPSSQPLAVPLKREAGGYFSGFAAGVGAGQRYRFKLDDDDYLYPDPASRYQPEGPHGPSEVVDPAAYVWHDGGWRGAMLDGQVIYELHLGTFTHEGTWAAAERELPELKALGVTMIEVMPIGEFPGQFGWGYDGVDIYAPSRLYGTPDDVRRFVDTAHRLGLAVILDVVYNHLGPDGNYLAQYSPDYFSRSYQCEWGDALNFDGPDSGPVREFFIANAGYWIDEFHFDGLRLDATQQIFDASPEHLVAAVTRRVREAAGGRSTVVIAENEPQEAKLVRPRDMGGYGLDGMWNDDFHHSARVAVTGKNEAYYTDYLGTPQELVSAVKWGFLYQGQRYKWQRQRRGAPAFGTAPRAFVNFVQNHDQVANALWGHRLHQLTSPGRWRAVTALLLLGPGTPLLFQGQEFAASAPFHYFADHHEELARLVKAGRREFVEQFRSIGAQDVSGCLPDPGDPATFAACKLDRGERERNGEAYALHRDLLRLRRDDPVISQQRADWLHGAVLGPEAFLLRWVTGGPNDRLLLVNFGRDLHLWPAPEPLLAPATDAGWEILWSSEDGRYGGCGTPPLETDDGWRIPAHAAVLLKPRDPSPSA